MILITPIACCVLLLWIPQLYNDWQLDKFSNNLFNYPPPPKTEVISRHAKVGLLGNGNHCDFVAEQVMITQLSKDEIESYYALVEFPPVNDHNEGLVPEAQGKPRPVFISFDGVRLENNWQRFTLRLVDVGYSAGLDIRCH